MITLQNMIFANPIAYQIFPNMVNTYNTSTTTEYAVYSGYLNLYKDNKLVKQFTGTSTIDLSDVSGRIRFDNVTDTYSAVVGEWDLAKSQDQIMEDNIRSAMVLWYDLKRQGATNESMAENPILRDLSGNGHDATCYNFAWSGMSGIGGYKTDYTTYNKYSSVEVTHNKITSTYVEGTDGYRYLIWHDAELGEISSYQVKVTGLKDKELKYSYVTENKEVAYFYIPEDGAYTLPKCYSTDYRQPIGFLMEEGREELLTIEQIPLYPHALVSDGVDDYCLVEGLPLLNKEDGYTVIAKRKWLDEDNEDSTAFASKATTANGLEGAFMFEYKDSSGTRKATRSFSVATIMEEFEKNDITYQSSSSYNGREIIAGDVIDNNDMVLFRFSTKDDDFYGEFALYSILLFNRDLTSEEIEWVKTNLIETEQ